MKNKFIKVITAVSLLSQISVAQNQSTNDLTISSGFINHRVVDQTISPMIYRGSTLPLFLEFNIKRKNYYHKLSAKYFKMSLKSSITNADRYNIHTLENLNFQIEYSVARKIFSTQNSNQSAGLKSSTFLNYRNLTMIEWGAGMTTTADHASSLSLFYNFSLKDIPIVFDMFDFNISTPFISYIILEGTYNANVNESFFNIDTDKNFILQLLKNGNFVSFNKFYQINSNIILTKNISNRLSTTVSYYFNFYSFNKYDKTLQVRSLNNAILWGFTYNITKNEN